MKRIAFFAFAIGCITALATKAQPYTIPWAQQQPAWVFPLWFESGDGQKDTLYLVYDPALDGTEEPSDTIFGVKPFCYSNDSFYVSWGGYIPCDSNGTLQYPVYWNSGFFININKAKYPFKIEWDRQLLFDTVLCQNGFPNIYPHPIARIRGYWAHPFTPHLMGTIENDIIADEAGLGCFTAPLLLNQDSIVFDGPLDDITVNQNGGPLALNFSLTAQGESCEGGSVPKREQKTFVVVWPNPFSSHLFLENKIRCEVDLRLTNALGQTCQTHRLASAENKTINVNELQPGIYNLLIISDRTFQTYKLVKL